MDSLILCIFCFVSCVTADILKLRSTVVKQDNNIICGSSAQAGEGLCTMQNGLGNTTIWTADRLLWSRIIDNKGVPSRYYDKDDIMHDYAFTIEQTVPGFLSSRKTATTAAVDILWCGDAICTNMLDIAHWNVTTSNNSGGIGIPFLKFKNTRRCISGMNYINNEKPQAVEVDDYKNMFKMHNINGKITKITKQVFLIDNDLTQRFNGSDASPTFFLDVATTRASALVAYYTNYAAQPFYVLSKNVNNMCTNIVLPNSMWYESLNSLQSCSTANRTIFITTYGNNSAVWRCDSRGSGSNDNSNYCPPAVVQNSSLPLVLPTNNKASYLTFVTDTAGNIFWGYDFTADVTKVNNNEINGMDNPIALSWNVNGQNQTNVLINNDLWSIRRSAYFPQFGNIIMQLIIEAVSGTPAACRCANICNINITKNKYKFCSTGCDGIESDPEYNLNTNVTSINGYPKLCVEKNLSSSVYWQPMDNVQQNRLQDVTETVWLLDNQEVYVGIAGQGEMDINGMSSAVNNLLNKAIATADTYNLNQLSTSSNSITWYGVLVLVLSVIVTVWLTIVGADSIFESCYRKISNKLLLYVILTIIVIVSISPILIAVIGEIQTNQSNPNGAQVTYTTISIPGPGPDYPGNQKVIGVLSLYTVADTNELVIIVLGIFGLFAALVALFLGNHIIQRTLNSNSTKTFAGDDTEAVADDDTEAVADDDTEAVADDDTETVADDDTEAVAGDDTKATDTVAGDPGVSNSSLDGTLLNNSPKAYGHLSSYSSFKSTHKRTNSNILNSMEEGKPQIKDNLMPIGETKTSAPIT